MGTAMRFIPDGRDGFRRALTNEDHPQPDGAPRHLFIKIHGGALKRTLRLGAGYRYYLDGAGGGGGGETFGSFSGGVGC